MMALGDDSGIYVHALDGFPGVHSRRWTGDEADDKLRNQLIVGYMRDEDNKTATLISRFSLVDVDGNQLFKTVVKNKFSVSDRLIGDKGFGYDSILIPDPNNVLAAFAAGKLSWERVGEIINQKLTIAELSQYEKNVINYRGRIAAEIKEFLDGQK